MEKTRVLFLCSANSARSQMAEALLRQLAGDYFEIHSAGLEAKGVNPFAIRALAEIGIDASSQRSKLLMEYMGKTHFGYLITVCARAEEKCPVFPGMGMRLHWPFDDPAVVEGSDEEKLAKFREVRDQIEAQIRTWLVSQGIQPAV